MTRLADMAQVHGPYRADWCEDCERQRLQLLAFLGNPETFVVDYVDTVTGEVVRLGDVANLLPGSSGQSVPSRGTVH